MPVGLAERARGINNKNLSGTRRRRQSSAQPKEALNARGQRSRERIKLAVREVLNETGYNNVRLQDAAARAGVATGLFYHYFRDLREAIAEVATDVFAVLVEDAPAVHANQHPYDWIYQNHLNVVQQFSRNPGVLHCLFGLSGNYEEFDVIWKDNAHLWNLQVAKFLQKEAKILPAQSEPFAFVLGAMTEGVIYQSLIRHTEDLSGLVKAPEDIAEIIAVMWYRAIFLSDPPSDLLRPSGRKLTGG